MALLEYIIIGFKDSKQAIQYKQLLRFYLNNLEKSCLE